MPTVQTTEKTENQELSTHPVKPVAKRTTPQRNAILESMQQTERLLGIEDRWNHLKINNKTQKSKKLKVSRLRPKLSTKNATSSLWSCCDIPETAKTAKLSPILEVAWQKPTETAVNQHKLDKNITNLQATVTKRLKN